MRRKGGNVVGVWGVYSLHGLPHTLERSLWLQVLEVLGGRVDLWVPAVPLDPVVLAGPGTRRSPGLPETQSGVAGECRCSCCRRFIMQQTGSKQTVPLVLAARSRRPLPIKQQMKYNQITLASERRADGACCWLEFRSFRKQDVFTPESSPSSVRRVKSLPDRLFVRARYLACV